MKATSCVTKDVTIGSGLKLMLYLIHSNPSYKLPIELALVPVFMLNIPHCRYINLQWGYFKLEDNQKNVENIISLPLTVKNNYLTWVNKHGTLIYTNMFYTVAPDKTNFRFYTNTVGGYMWGSIGFI